MAKSPSSQQQPPTRGDAPTREHNPILLRAMRCKRLQVRTTTTTIRDESDEDDGGLHTHTRNAKCMYGATERLGGLFPEGDERGEREKRAPGAGSGGTWRRLQTTGGKDRSDAERNDDKPTERRQ